jgi:hypothetical protein
MAPPRAAPVLGAALAAVRLAALAAALACAVLLPVLTPATARADAFGAELTVLTTHVLSQRDAPVQYYPRKLDSKGRFVLTPGLEAYYEWELSEPLWQARQIQLAGGQISDSVEHRLGYLAVMGRWVLAEGGRTTWSLQAGPGFLYRKSWRDVPGYMPDNALHESSRFLPGYEWAFLPLGKLDLNYRIRPGLEAVWSIFPGIPYVIVQSLGLRWSF